MQRRTRLGVAILTLAMVGGLLVGSSLPASGRTTASAHVRSSAIQRLRSDAEGAVTLSIDSGTRYVGFARVSRGGDLFPASASATPKGKALGFLSRYASLFGIQDASAELRQVSTVKDAYGFTHVTFEQRYRGLPVFGGVMRVHLDRGNRLTAVNGTFTPNVDLDVTPRLSASQAAQKAIAEVTANPPLSEGTADAAAAAPTGLRAASTTLEVYRMGLVRNVPGSNQLVYEVEVSNGRDVREFVFVHANAGKIVNRYSGAQSDLFRRVFEVDLDHQVWQEGDPFPGSLNIDQQHIVTFSGQAYYHFLHAFGRDSYDGLGHEMRTVNNDPRINCPNANWNGATTNYCTGVTADDVVAHEWGHAYTEFTDNLIYQWQSGALNESYSDIWGDVVDQINGVGTDTPGGARTVERCSTFANNWPTVVVNEPETGRCAAAPAVFGPALNTTGVTGDVALSNDGKGSPTDGCTSPNNMQAIDGNIALVDRGTCAFTVKVANMQKAGATGVMIANNVFGGPSIMQGADPSIQIPSVMITIGQGAAFKNDLAAGPVNVTMRARTGSQGSYRWLVGEDATAFGGAIRDMWDPTCIGDPGKVTDQEYFCASTDNGGVHSNSGVPNHGFALLTNGGTYNGHTVAGIGLAKAAAIYWRAQSVYQTPSSDFTDHAESLEQSCADLVGQKVNNLSTASTPNHGPRPTITAGNCTSVAEMTQAVEFRQDPTEQCHFQPILQPDAPPVCGDQPATEVFKDDFESGLDGWTLSNQGVYSGWPGLDWTTDSSLPAGRAGSAAFGADPDAGDCGAGDGDISGLMSMQSPSIVLPGGTLRLSFTHYIASEQGFDGGNVWISVNGRAYTQIPASAFLFNPYNQALVTAAGGNTNPMAGQPAFTGTDANKLVSSWGTSIVDLAATGARIGAGDTVRFRFDFGMDGCAGIDGWFVDNVTVSACGAAAAATKEDTASARSTPSPASPYARAVDVHTYRPDPSEFAWTFGGVPPVRTVRPGDILELWTEDAFGGKVRGPDDHVSRVIEFPFVNPQTGPFFVESAQPGDTLAIHFISIEPSRDWAASCTVPLFGALTTTARTTMLHDPLPERVWIYDVDREARNVTYRATEGDHVAVLPLDPMHGTVGVAPAAFEARSSLVPDSHGGNMDTPEMRAGVTCYLGVNVEGALFSIGDGHCRQGEGETCGVAVEAAMDTVIAIDVVKGRSTPWPRLESDTHVMSTGSARPLEDAFRIAHADLVSWMGEEFGLETLDAYQLLTQVSESPVANVVDPNYTFLTKVSKSYLPRVDAYDGVHARLRETAARYRG